MNPVKYKINNKYSDSSIKLNYLNKNINHSQHNKKKYLNHNSNNNVINDQSRNSSQNLKDKNNHEIYIINNENNGQKDVYQTIINNGLYRNTVYKRKFLE